MRPLRRCLHDKTRTGASFIPGVLNRVYSMTGSFHKLSRYLKVHFMLLKYTCDSKSQTLRMNYSF